MENEFYFAERFSKGQAWIDLLLLANHKPTTIYIRGNEVCLERGQLGYAITSLSERWRWNERTVDSYLSMLSKREMIQYKKTHVTTLITILNYDLYQSSTEQNTEQNTEPPTEQSKNRIQTNKNDKNNEKDNNIYSDIFSFWNSKGIIQHRRLDNKSKSKIKSLLKYYSPEEIKSSIKNYATILSDPQLYYFDYRWTLKDFLARGFEKFIDLKTAQLNFRNKQKALSFVERLEQQNKECEKHNELEQCGFISNGDPKSFVQQLMSQSGGSNNG